MSTRPGPGSASTLLRMLAAAAAAAALLESAAAFASSDPDALRNVVFSGNSAVAASDLRPAISLRPGDRLTAEAVRRAADGVVARYRERSYFGASARAEAVPAGGGRADLLVTVDEGVRSTLGALEIRGDSSLPPGRAARAFGMAEGSPLDGREIERGIVSLLAEYDRISRPFARARVERIAPLESGGMLLAIGVDGGDSVMISSIRVEGNTETRAGVVLRESRMDLPAPYDPAAISRYSSRLRRMGIFAAVEEPALFRDGEDYGLLVRVTEGRSGSFDGLLGYAPPAGGTGPGAVTGRASVTLGNLFGTARRLEAGWGRPGGSTQEIRLAYEEPWTFGYPVSLGAAFAQRQQDSSFVDRRLSISAEVLLSASLSVSALAERQTVIPSAGSAGDAVPGSSALTGGAAVRYDSRDDAAYPRSGVLYRSELRTGRRTPSGGRTPGTSSGIRRTDLDLDVFLATGGDRVLRLAVRGRDVAAGTPEPGDLVRVGGSGTLRGFREERFSGTRAVWGTVEYRLPAGGGGFFYGFIDPGYIAGPGGELFTFGYGTGMRVATGVGMLAVSFALGRGEPVSETKLHVGLANTF